MNTAVIDPLTPEQWRSFLCFMRYLDGHDWWHTPLVTSMAEWREFALYIAAVER